MYFLKHPLLIRLLHWGGTFGLGLMVWSGLMIYWAHDPYRIVLGGKEIFHFFPDAFYEAFGLTRKLALGLGWHLAIQWVYTLGIVGYTLYVFISGRYKKIWPRRLRDLPQAVVDAFNDTIPGRPHPKALMGGYYNATQALAYLVAIALSWMLLLSGWAIYKPAGLAWLTTALGGYEMSRFWHFTAMMLLIGFVLVHIIQVIRAGWGNFTGMVEGHGKVEGASAGLVASMPIKSGMDNRRLKDPNLDADRR